MQNGVLSLEIFGLFLLTYAIAMPVIFRALNHLVHDQDSAIFSLLSFGLGFSIALLIFVSFGLFLASIFGEFIGCCVGLGVITYKMQN